MNSFTFQELLRAVVATILNAWRPCQPLLAVAALIALAIAAFVGFVLPEGGATVVAQALLFVLTRVVSAGISGFVVTGDQTYTRFDSVIREPRAYAFILRQLLLAVVLSLPLLVVMAGLAQSGGVAGGAALVGLGLSLVVVWLAVRLLPFPYTVFLGQPLTLGETFQSTSGHGLKILGCTMLCTGLALVTLLMATQLIAGLMQGIGTATGLGGGRAAAILVTSLGEIAMVYVVDCVGGTVTRFVTGRRGSTAAVEQV